MAVTVEEKIKGLNLREKDKPKVNRDILKNVGVGQNLERTLKNFRQEFNEKFDKPKTPEERKMTTGKGEKKALPAKKIKDPRSKPALAKGGRAMYKSGSKGCKLATKGKGRAYGKNS